MSSPSHNNNKVKILLVGSVGDNLTVLRKKLRALNASKAGPFDACFCVGPVRYGQEKDDKGNNNGNDKETTEAETDGFPIPVYFQEMIPSNNNNSNSNSVSTTTNCEEDDDDDQGIVSLVGGNGTATASSNLYYLKGKNKHSNINSDALQIFKIQLGSKRNGSIRPLLVASCSRRFRAPAQQQNQQHQSRSQSQSQSMLYPHCDLLLSPDWPQGMEDVLNVDTEPLSYDVAEAALACRPRYHLCPSSDLFHVSQPYQYNGHTSNTNTNTNSNHCGRFLALAPVRKGKTPKTHKWVHALGLVPILSNPEPSGGPYSSLLPCPFARSGGASSINTNNNNRNNNGNPKTTAMPDFAMKADTYDAAYSRFGDPNNKKRGRDNNSNVVSLEPPDDPSISTLFLYGLHKDVTGELQSTRSPKVLHAFAKYGVTKVRHPPNVPTSTYCFLEFPSQTKASECLSNCHGRITIDSVNLTLKWATKSGGTATSNNNDGKRQRRDQLQQQNFVTQIEAKDSTTLFFHPPKNTKLLMGTSSDSNGTRTESTPLEEEATTTATRESDDTKKINDEVEKLVVDHETDDLAKTAASTTTTNSSSDGAGDHQGKETKIETARAGEDAAATAQNTGPEERETDKRGQITETNATATTNDEEKEENNNSNDTTIATTETTGNEGKKEGDPGTKSSKAATGFAAILQHYIQSVLEDALNEGVENDDERVTAETEPALRVQVRCVKDQYGFLEFASHAAATMALAAITKSTDGGLLVAAGSGDETATTTLSPPKDLLGTTLRWAKGSSSHATNNQNKNKTTNGREQVLKALGLKRQYHPADGRKDCWFCLSSPTCETHLITGVYDQWYATMPKGPVHPGHVLLVPVTHTSEGAWTLNNNDEWVRLVEKVQEHASREYDMDLFVFERSMETRGGYHTHIQCVPVPRDSSTRLQTTMIGHAKASGFDLRPIQSDLGVKAMLEKNDSYFYAEIRTVSHQHRFLYRCGSDDSNNNDERGSRVPLQFAREVLASVLDNSKLAHWKACVVDKEQETKLASDFRTSFNAI